VSVNPRNFQASDLAGVMVALLTPIDSRGRIDDDALRDLVVSVIAGGVAGVCPAGTTGEGASLALADRRAIVETVVATVPDDMPVVPGVFRDTTAEAIADIEEYARAGASGVLVAPPHYYTLTAKDIHAFYDGILERSTLPLVVYNIPAFTKNAVPPSVLVTLAGHPLVVGVKDSSRDMEYLLAVCDGLSAAGIGPEEFGVMTGTDTMLLASLAVGAQGAIVASANVVPELSCGAYLSWRNGDEGKARATEQMLRRVVGACRVGSFPAGWKGAAAAIGLCGPWLVPPRWPLEPADIEALTVTLGNLGLLPAEGVAGAVTL